MKLTTGIVALALTAGTAWAQNPAIIQNTKDALNNVQQQKTAASNAALQGTPGKPSGAVPAKGSAATPAKAPAAVPAKAAVTPAKTPAVVPAKAAQSAPTKPQVVPAKAVQSAPTKPQVVPAKVTATPAKPATATKAAAPATTQTVSKTPVTTGKTPVVSKTASPMSPKVTKAAAKPEVKVAAKPEVKAKPDVKAAKAAEKKPGAETKANAEASTESDAAKTDKEDKKYSMTGKRDPFLSPVVNRASGSGCSTGKKCLDIEQIALHGVVKSDNGMIAVVTNGLNKAYFLRENDPVFNGYVLKITVDSVVFKETFQDRLGKPFTKDVVKRILTPAV
jgi:Tfp pilus assembly protein PilP